MVTSGWLTLDADGINLQHCHAVKRSAFLYEADEMSTIIAVENV